MEFPAPLLPVQTLGETLLEKGCPPDPFPKPLNAIRGYGINPISPNCTESLRGSLEDSAPKRIAAMSPMEERFDFNKEDKNECKRFFHGN